MHNLSLIGKVMKEAALSGLRPKINDLILHVTNRCNMRCRHCFVSFDNPQKELTLDEIRSVAKVIPDPIWLNIGGGEPLLRNDLEEIISLFDFCELGLPTNGWDTDRTVARMEKIHRMTAGKLIASLSLDGLQKIHDAMRCPGSFDRVLRTFRDLKKIKGLRVKFNTVLCEANSGEVLELMRFVKTLRPAFHSIILLRGSPLDPSMRLPSWEKIEALEKEIYSIQQSYDYGRTGVLSRVQRNYQAYKRDLAEKILREKRQVVPCLAGRSHLVVWADGNVAPCELLSFVGNIRTESLDALLNGEKMQTAIARIRASACFCTHDCNMIENILFNPRTYRKLLVS